MRDSKRWKKIGWRQYWSVRCSQWLCSDWNWDRGVGAHMIYMEKERWHEWSQNSVVYTHSRFGLINSEKSFHFEFNACHSLIHWHIIYDVYLQRVRYSDSILYYNVICYNILMINVRKNYRQCVRRIIYSALTNIYGSKIWGRFKRYFSVQADEFYWTHFWYHFLMERNRKFAVKIDFVFFLCIYSDVKSEICATQADLSWPMEHYLIINQEFWLRHCSLVGWIYWRIACNQFAKS